MSENFEETEKDFKITAIFESDVFSFEKAAGIMRNIQVREDYDRNLLFALAEFYELWINNMWNNALTLEDIKCNDF